MHFCSYSNISCVTTVIFKGLLYIKKIETLTVADVLNDNQAILLYNKHVPSFNFCQKESLVELMVC